MNTNLHQSKSKTVIRSDDFWPSIQNIEVNISLVSDQAITFTFDVLTFIYYFHKTMRNLKTMLWALLACLYLLPLSAQNQDSDLNVAKASLEKAQQGNDPKVLATAYLNLAKAYKNKSQFPLAREHFLKGISHLDSLNQPKIWADTHSELGSIFSAMGSFEEAFEAFDQAAKFYQQQKDYNTLGRLFGRIGYTYLNKGEFKKAEVHLNEGNAYFDKAETLDSTSWADLQITIGILWSQRSDYTQAIPYYEAAESMYHKLDNRQRLMYVYNNLSGVYFSHGNLPKALESLQQTLKLSKEFNYNQGVSAALGNIARIYQTRKDYEEAINYLEQSLKVNEEIGDSIMLCRLHNNIGGAFQKQEKLDKAFEQFQKGLQIGNQIGDKTGIASSHLALGKLYITTKNYPLAKSHLDKSRILWEEIEKEKSKAKVYLALGELALAQKEFTQAISWCEKSYEISEAIQLLVELGGNCACLAESYEAIGSFKSALSFHKQYKSAKDSLVNEEQASNIARLEMQYQFDAEKDLMAIDQEYKDDLINNQLKRQTMIRNASLGGLLAGSIILLLLWRSYQLKKESNQVLEIQKNEIQKALDDRETLLKEIHHRVKNNLQVVSSLLSLQSRTIDDPTALDAIEEGKNRVKAMALIHQNLYQKENLVGVDLPEYIEKLTDSLIYSYQVDTEHIGIERHISPISIDVDTLIPLGLILNEIISNALKHAFPNREKGNIFIKINQEEEGLNVIVKDDGIGLPQGFNFGTSNSLGFKLIRSFVNKMKAKLEVLSQDGTSIRILLPS